MKTPIEILKDLVAINSVNPKCQADGPGEAECADYIVALLQKNGIDFELQEVFPGRNNVIATLEGRGKSKRLVFEAHMDVVSTAGMTIPPFQPNIREGKLYGRGACDTKGSLASMLAATIASKESKERQATIVLVATVDEEDHYRGVARYIQDCAKANGAVVGEPTRLDAVIAHKGCVRWRTVVHGKACHTSQPQLGVNAISKAATLIAAIEEDWLPQVRAQKHPLLGGGEMTISLIGGGTQINFVPDQCWIEIDRRTLPGEDSKSVLAELQPILDGLQRKDPDFRGTIGPISLEDFALKTEWSEPIARVGLAACQSVHP